MEYIQPHWLSVDELLEENAQAERDANAEDKTYIEVLQMLCDELNEEARNNSELGVDDN